MSNKTALVTGASDGIGLEFCKILAAKGYDIILVARRKTKLNELAKSLSKHHKNISCTVISSDLSKPCLLYTSPSPRDGLLSRMPSSA